LFCLPAWLTTITLNGPKRPAEVVINAMRVKKIATDTIECGRSKML
jgi:hypothetical protein